MNSINLNTNISELKGIGNRMVWALERKGIQKVKDLIFYFPFRYDNFSEIKTIKDLRLGEKATIQGEIKKIGKKTTRRRFLTLVEAWIEDKTGLIKIVWFNQPYLLNSLKQDQIYRFSGKVDFQGDSMNMVNPSFEKAESPNVNTGGLLPVYHEDNYLNSRWLRRIIYPLLPLAKGIPETLPEILRNNYKLLSLPEAVQELHFPTSEALKEAARTRIAFEELFLIQLYLGLNKLKWKSYQAPPLPLKINLIKKFVKGLPFVLTNAQRRSAWEILQNLTRLYPMNRLLEGDVGSGKTVVAAVATLNTIKSGYQVIILAPTEILAFQHFKTLTGFFEKHLKTNEICLFTRSQKKVGSKKSSQPEILKNIASGSIKLICATHTVLSDKVKFKKPGLIVIDEQHRFGVTQRGHLLKRQSAEGKYIPHLLSLTATPIPRTLALAIYSDLELSILNELPKGRKAIISRIIPPALRDKMYQFIRNQIKNGRQAFVICPLIEDKGDGFLPSSIFTGNFSTNRKHQLDLTKTEVKAVKKEQKILKEKVFPEFKIALLHGRLKGKEKEKIMRDFKERKYQILVSTSVVEVGVDIPNASVMLVEGAERFGLAQLHQFRGRVGRSNHQSYCFLALSEGGVKANRRLEALVKSHDGFKLAEQDLKIRGPGEFIGERQSGLPDLTMASLSDTELIKTARGAASLILSHSPDLTKYPVLKIRLGQLRKKFHGE